MDAFAPNEINVSKHTGITGESPVKWYVEVDGYLLKYTRPHETTSSRQVAQLF